MILLQPYPYYISNSISLRFQTCLRELNAFFKVTLPVSQMQYLKGYFWPLLACFPSPGISYGQDESNLPMTPLKCALIELLMCRVVLFFFFFLALKQNVRVRWDEIRFRALLFVCSRHTADNQAVGKWRFQQCGWWAHRLSTDSVPPRNWILALEFTESTGLEVLAMPHFLTCKQQTIMTYSIWLCW